MVTKKEYEAVKFLQRKLYQATEDSNSTVWDFEEIKKLYFLKEGEKNARKGFEKRK